MSPLNLIKFFVIKNIAYSYNSNLHFRKSHMTFLFNCSVWMLLITWIIKQWFSECHLLFPMEQHLFTSMSKKLTFPRRKCRQAAHSALLCHPALMPPLLGAQVHAHLQHQRSLSCSAQLQLNLQQPGHCNPPSYSDFWTGSVQPPPASFSTLISSDIPLGTLLDTQVPASPSQSTLLSLNKFPLEVIAITRQSPLLIYLLLSPMFNYSVQHKMSPGSDLKQNSNPSPVLRYNFHGQQSFSSSERRNEKHRKSLPMKASSSSASACPPAQEKLSSPTETQSSFLRNLKMSFFQKAWSTCCRQLTGRENEAPNLK